MARRPGKARAEAVERFAAELATLREAAGRPSFRVMSGRSCAISHTTLHEASQGHRLPSWETTVEYVRACGADPEDFRERWEQARRRASRARAPGRRRPPPSLVEPPPEAAPDQAAAETVPTSPRLVAIGAVGAVVMALTVTVTVAAHVLTPETRGAAPTGGVAPGATHAPEGGADGAPLSVGGAPCTATPGSSPTATPAPRHSGDVVALVADVTLPDCARVPPGVVRTKTWRLRNTGSVVWSGYSLRRLELPQHGDTCQTIPEVPVPTTRPGESSEVSVQVMMPRQSASCLVHFAMTDAAGDLAFPGRRPLHLRVRVG